MSSGTDAAREALRRSIYAGIYLPFRFVSVRFDIRIRDNDIFQSGLLRDLEEVTCVGADTSNHPMQARGQMINGYIREAYLELPLANLRLRGAHLRASLDRYDIGTWTPF
jgi:hypothetical protein